MLERFMLAEKIKKTLALTFFVCAAAVSADYVVSVRLLNTPQVFSPLKTFILALLLTVPVGYVLITQRINIHSVEDALLKSIAEHAAALSEIGAANAKLKESEALYRLLADNQTDIISLWAANGENLYTSSSAERWFGFTNAERSALEHSVNLHPDDVERVLAVRSSVTVECGHQTAEFRVLAKDGSVLWV
jgi:PAS domain S-box-containing protein